MTPSDGPLPPPEKPRWARASRVASRHAAQLLDRLSGRPPAQVVSVLIDDAERRAERVISLVRIAVALGLSWFMFTSIRGTIPEYHEMLSGQFVIAAATLLLYGVLGVVSYILSSAARHRRWHLYLFAFLDVAFVLLSLRGALINTDLPASYLTALPSIWLIPVILVFGTMRFGLRLQAFTGAVLLVGILALFLAFDDGRSFDAPLPPRLSPFFSDPPNAMRMVMITVAVAILVLAVARSRQLLTAALSDERRADALTRYMPPQVAEIITGYSSADLRRGVRQEVAVLFIDIRSFTARSETMTPDALVAFLAHYRALLREAADAFGGMIDKFVGDGAMVVFGIPQSRPDDAARAVAYARRVLSEIQSWSHTLESDGQPPLRVAIGIHADTAFIGAIGDSVRLEFTVLGDMVNVASRIGELAKGVESGLAMSARTAQRAGLGPDDVLSLGATAIRGHKSGVELVALRASPDLPAAQVPAGAPA